MSQFFWTQRKSHDDVVGDPVVPAAPTTPVRNFQTLRNARACTQQYRLEGFTGERAKRLGYHAALLIDGWDGAAAKLEALRVFPREGTT